MKADMIYLPHGGGPMPVLGGTGHEKMIAFLRDLSGRIPMPDEILVISAHWEEEVPTVISSENPGLLYDYYGFPEEAYRIKYPVPGNPGLANEITDLLENNGIESKRDSERGFDHGVFIPLMLIYPEASVPVTQLSLKRGLDAAEHIRIGRALRGLLDRDILIIGSGFSFHNMQAFSFKGNESPDKDNEAFQDWLIETCCEIGNDEDREKRLVNWTSAPGARYCHPREEHLLPLHVCQAMAGTEGQVVFDDYVVGKRALAILWNSQRSRTASSE